MELIPTKLTRLLVVTILISIAAVWMPITHVNAFAIRAQAAGKSFSRIRDSTSNTRQSSEKLKSSLGTFHRHRHNHHQSLPTASGTSLQAVAAAAALPGLGSFAAAAFLSSCSGLWRTGYAVSYGYGGVMLSSGLIQLFAAAGKTSRAALPLQLHAALYVLYGVRLCWFLLHREIALPVEIHQMKRRDAAFSERLKRLPVITGCSVLFFCMAAAPMRILALTNPSGNALTTATLAVGFLGFSLAAVGDWYKCKIKARDGPDTLVTSGPFRYFRHPNYTGEMILWTCVCLLMPLVSVGGNIRRTIPWLLSSFVGWAGMVFPVLIGEATVGLEQKQKEKYGGTPEYEEWIKSSWSGPMLVGSDK
jgi:steroid 5-alpha reductase family enzyme